MSKIQTKHDLPEGHVMIDGKTYRLIVNEPITNDTFRRDLIAQLYVGIVTQTIAAVLISGEQIDAMGNGILTQACIEAADTLIKHLEGTK